VVTVTSTLPNPFGETAVIDVAEFAEAGGAGRAELDDFGAEEIGPADARADAAPDNVLVGLYGFAWLMAELLCVYRFPVELAGLTSASAFMRVYFASREIEPHKAKVVVCGRAHLIMDTISALAWKQVWIAAMIIVSCNEDDLFGAHESANGGCTLSDALWQRTQRQNSLCACPENKSCLVILTFADGPRDTDRASQSAVLRLPRTYDYVTPEVPFGQV
jgi:hypothetical protein